MTPWSRSLSENFIKKQYLKNGIPFARSIFNFETSLPIGDCINNVSSTHPPFIFPNPSNHIIKRSIFTPCNLTSIYRNHHTFSKFSNSSFQSFSRTFSASFFQPSLNNTAALLPNLTPSVSSSKLSINLNHPSNAYTRFSSIHSSSSPSSSSPSSSSPSPPSPSPSSHSSQKLLIQTDSNSNSKSPIPKHSKTNEESQSEGEGAEGGGEYKESIIPWLEQFAKESERKYGSHEYTANAFLRLAQAYHENAKPPQQVYDAASKAWKYYEKIKTENDLVGPICLNIMALATTALEGPEAAIKLLQKSLNLVDEKKGKDHLLIKYNSYMIMGDAWSFLSRHQDAVWCMLEGFKCLEKAREEDEGLSNFFGVTLRRIAEVYFSLTNYEEAERFALDALKHHRGGKEDAVTMDEINDRRLLSSIYSQSGELAKALSHLETIRSIFEERGEIIEIAHADMAIADLLILMEKYDQAIPAFESSIRIQRDHVGDSHPLIASTLSSMAYALVKAGRMEEAERLSGDALSIIHSYKEEGGDFLESMADSLTEIGDVYDIMKKHKQAIQLFKEAIEKRQRIPGQLLSISGTEMNIGVIQVGLLEYEQALQTFTNVLPKVRTVFGKDNATVASVQHYVGIALCGLDRKTEAVGSFKEAIRVLTDSDDDNVELFADVCASLATVLHDLGSHEEAMKYQEMVINSRILMNNGEETHPLIDKERERLESFKKAKEMEQVLKVHNSIVQKGKEGKEKEERNGKEGRGKSRKNA